MIYLKKGELAFTPDNDLVLVSIGKKPFRVDNTVAILWSLCDGQTTIDHIIYALADEAEVNVSHIYSPLATAIIELVQAGLLIPVEQ